MGGTTANGWPYVTPTDKPLEFPAHSQALANKLQSRLGQTQFQAAVSQTNASGTVTVTFATPFATQPVVVATALGQNAIVSMPTNASTTQVTFSTITHAGAVAANCYVSWLAVWGSISPSAG